MANQLTPTANWKITLAGSITFAAMLAAGCSDQPITAARFQVTVYEVRVAPARTAELDASALEAKAGTPSQLQQALEQFGPTKVLYKADQAIDLTDKSRINISSRVPFVTGTRLLESGKKMRSVQYQSIGALFEIAPRSAEPAGGEVDLQIRVELSALTDSPIEVSSGTSALGVHSVSLTHNGPVRLGHALVMLTVDAAAKDKQGKAVAYVVRMALGP